MKYLLIGLAVLAGVILLAGAAVVVIGYSLEPRHTAARSRLIRRGAPDLYRAVRDVERYPEWRPDVESVQLLPTEDGRIRFREEGGEDPVTFEITEDVPERRLVATIVDTDLGYSGSWTYTFEPQGGAATLVTITENGEVTNPVFRFFSRFVFGHTSGLEKYLEALDRRNL